jgi:hypothetical protein
MTREWRAHWRATFGTIAISRIGQAALWSNLTDD